MATNTQTAAARKIARVMHEFKEGTLESGGSGTPVKSREQAIAIALSEARKVGGSIPPAKKAKSSRVRKSKR